MCFLREGERPKALFFHAKKGTTLPFLLPSYAFMYAKVYCVGRDKKNYGLSFPLEIVKKENREQNESTSRKLEEYLFSKHCQNTKLTQLRLSIKEFAVATHLF